jgi:hypothetical protein
MDLPKFSTVEIADIIQCSKVTILRLWKTWKKTGDVKRIYRRVGRPLKMLRVGRVSIFTLVRTGSAGQAPGGKAVLGSKAVLGGKAASGH